MRRTMGSFAAACLLASIAFTSCRIAGGNPYSPIESRFWEFAQARLWELVFP